MYTCSRYFWRYIDPRYIDPNPSLGQWLAFPHNRKIPPSPRTIPNPSLTYKSASDVQYAERVNVGSSKRETNIIFALFVRYSYFCIAIQQVFIVNRRKRQQQTVTQRLHVLSLQHYGF